ncbi:MAG: hypothetical protein HYZ53_27785, partial [Planctomycetes bacterium]|nr:hypothetical protein [Planctomycetota bacterium]
MTAAEISRIGRYRFPGPVGQHRVRGGPGRGCGVHPCPYFGALPVRIDVEALRKDPRASSATPRPDVRAFSFGTWLSLPGLFVRGFGMERKARALLAAHAQFVRGTWAPALVARVRAE